MRSPNILVHFLMKMPRRVAFMAREAMAAPAINHCPKVAERLMASIVMIKGICNNAWSVLNVRRCLKLLFSNFLVSR